MLAKTVGFIGGGRIARIVLESLRNKKQLPETITVSDSNQEVLNDLQSRFPAINVTQDNTQPAGQELVFVALHPPVIGETLSQVKTQIKPNTVLISLAPKVTISQMAGFLGGFNRIIRMIPNAPTIVNKGYNPVVFADGFEPDEKSELLSFFEILGDCPEVNETLLEAYAVLTAMGPTYFWFQLFELQEIVENFGLTQDEAKTGVIKMITGSLAAMYESQLSKAEVMDLVPVKPLKDEEEHIKQAFRANLKGIYQKLKG